VTAGVAAAPAGRRPARNQRCPDTATPLAQCGRKGGCEVGDDSQVSAKRRTVPKPAPHLDEEVPDTERAARLLRAIEAVEELLPPPVNGPYDWPERTDQLGSAVTEVRRLAVTFEPHEWESKWPRPRCGRCAGRGWFWLDPDMDSRCWDPCRTCLTTGVELLADRWSPAPTHVNLEPYER
jgi:hypothetical protein